MLLYRIILLSLVLLFAQSAFSQLPEVETLAGNGLAGYIDSTGTNAQLSSPHSIAFDLNGNIYFCDNGNNVVRMITPQGLVSTIAGDGTSGHINGPVADARFESLLGICLLPDSGSIYVTEFNHRVRKISGGIVSDYAGNGLAGSSNGIGLSASFNVPTAIALGLNDNMFVLDRLNHKIRNINLINDSVSDYVGNGMAGLIDGPASMAQFDRPHDFCLDNAGNIFVADRDNHVIRKVDVNGNVTTIAGTGSPGYVDGNGVNASFDVPAGIAIDNLGNLFVGDRSNHVIRKIDPSYNVTTFAGTGFPGFQDGSLATASFNFPSKLAFDTLTSILYISDVGNHAIRKIDLSNYVGIEEAKVLRLLTVYPNPVIDEFYVKYYLTKATEVGFTITNIKGTILRSKKITRGEVGENSLYFEIPSYISDTNLLLTLEVDGITYSSKIIRIDR